MCVFYVGALRDKSRSLKKLLQQSFVHHCVHTDHDRTETQHRMRIRAIRGQTAGVSALEASKSRALSIEPQINSFMLNQRSREVPAVMAQQWSQS